MIDPAKLPEIERRVRELHADGRMREWTARHLGLTRGQLDTIQRRLGISWPHTRGPREFPCPNGHSVDRVGMDESNRCMRCREVVVPPHGMHLVRGVVTRRFCKNGHDTAATGRITLSPTRQMVCKVCVEDAAARRKDRRKRRPTAPKPEKTADSNYYADPGRVTERVLALRCKKWGLPHWEQDEIQAEIDRLESSARKR